MISKMLTLSCLALIIAASASSQPLIDTAVKQIEVVIPDHDPAIDELREDAKDAMSQEIELSNKPILLSEYINAIQESTSQPITVNWQSLEQVGIDPETEVGELPFSIRADTLLKLALLRAGADAFKDDKPDYAVIDGIVLISTRRELKGITETRIYNIGPILREKYRPISLLLGDADDADLAAYHDWLSGRRAYPFADWRLASSFERYTEALIARIEELEAQARAEQGDGINHWLDEPAGRVLIARPEDVFPRQADAFRISDVRYQQMIDPIVEIIQTTVGDADEWLDDVSTIAEANGRLVIRTTAENHETIEKLLNEVVGGTVREQADVLADMRVMATLRHAYAAELEGKRDLALSLVEDALEIDDKHATTLALKVYLQDLERRGIQTPSRPDPEGN